MRNWYPVALVVACLVGLTGCSRREPTQTEKPLAGDAVWFPDGVGAADADVESLLTRGGFSSVFLPASRLTRQSGKWIASPPAPPERPFSRVPVCLVIEGDDAVEAALGSPQTNAMAGMAEAIWLGIKTALREAPRFGSVKAVHLDLPYPADAVEAYGKVVQEVRAKLPRGILLSISLRFAPSREQKKTWKPLQAAADAFVAMLFGEGKTTDPVAADQLQKPWWAGYDPAARGQWTDAEGGDRGSVEESVLARLSDDPSVDFADELTLKDESSATFFLKPRHPISLGERTFAVGDHVSFRQPALSDLIYHLGVDLAGRRFVRGRVILLRGRSDSERIFTLAALNDILLGRRLQPDVRVSVESGRGFVRVSAENASPHASVVSRMSNWIDVDLPWGGIQDVQAGGFDRFEVFAPDGRAVTLGRATRVRFYETLIAPLERIEPARITVRGSVPAGCCSTRIHVLAASGAEIATGWASPTPTDRGER